MNNQSNSKFNRKSIRLKGYDYAQEGIYFITICCKQHKCLFGNIFNGKMILNSAGKIAEKCWVEIPQHFTNVVLHEFVIMPNHIHGILEIAGTNKHSPENRNEIKNKTENEFSFLNENLGAKNISPLRSPSKTIGSVVRGFKIGVTKWFRQNTTTIDVWQRNYYDIIVRNQQSYQRISSYIVNNPVKWNDDKFYVQ